jgi:hypothetical protein
MPSELTLKVVSLPKKEVNTAVAALLTLEFRRLLVVRVQTRVGQVPEEPYLIEILRDRRLVSDGGGPGSNCAGELIAHGVIVANWRWTGPAKSGSAGCQAGSGPTTKGGRAAVNPSLLRNARIAFATVWPQAKPRTTACPLLSGSVAASSVSKVDFCRGKSATSVV